MCLMISNTFFQKFDQIIYLKKNKFDRVAD